MTATPDTSITPTAQDEQLLDALTEALGDEDTAVEVFDKLEPALAEIRRHAAADALREQAERFGKLRATYLKQAAVFEYGSEARTSTHLRSREVAHVASMLRQAAQDVIAEGYEHTCGASWAATRTDPGYGCDNAVPNEGDLCDRHDSGDEEDRWAE